MKLPSDHPIFKRKAPIKWKQHEEDVRQDFSGWKTPGSGNTPFSWNKGDVQTDEYIVELKVRKGSYRMTFKELMLLKKLAQQNDKMPVFGVRFDVPVRSVDEETDWVVLPYSVFKEMLSAIGKVRAVPKRTIR